MRGHLGFKVRVKVFTPFAVILTTNGSSQTYTVPSGAVSMTAWAVGAGGSGGGPCGAGGTVWSSYSVTAGQAITYNSNLAETPFPAAPSLSIAGHSAVTVAGATMKAFPGRRTSQSFSSAQSTYGVDISGYGWGTATGGTASNGGEAYSAYLGAVYGGAIGAADRSNGYFVTNRTPAGSAVANLKNAVALAGGKVTEDDAPLSPAFGSGGYYSSASYGYGGSSECLEPSEYGGGSSGCGANTSGVGCVVLYFS